MTGLGLVVGADASERSIRDIAVGQSLRKAFQPPDVNLSCAPISARRQLL